MFGLTLSYCGWCFKSVGYLYQPNIMHVFASAAHDRGGTSFGPSSVLDRIRGHLWSSQASEGEVDLGANRV